MQNRLEFFRERMAAFEASANPKSAIDRGYYVEEPRGSISSRMLGRLALRPSTSHILVGGIGSGKTTQLLKLEKELNSIPDIFAQYVDVCEYTNDWKVFPGTFIAITGSIVKDLVRNNSLEVLSRISSVELTLENWRYIVSQKAKNRYIIQEVPIESDIDFLSSIKFLISRIDEPLKHITILFDGLDRIRRTSGFTDSLVSDLPILNQLGVGSVIIAPLFSLYREQYKEIIKQVSNYSDYYKLCYDTERDPEAKKFLEKIIMSRSPLNFIEEIAIEELVKYSGGVIRDLINLTQSSIEEAYLSGEDKVSLEHVHSALISFSSAQFLGLSKEEIGILEEVINDQEFYPKTEEEFKLLLSRRILEYTYPKRRFVVHPAIKMGLKEKVA